MALLNWKNMAEPKTSAVSAADLKKEKAAFLAKEEAFKTTTLAEIEAKLADLAAMRDTLATLIRRCERTHGKVACPIIAALAASEASDTAPPKARVGAARRSKTKSATRIGGIGNNSRRPRKT